MPARFEIVASTAILALGAGLGGCVVGFEETTLVRVRDPAAVSLSERTDHGRLVILSGDADHARPEVREVTPGEPPFVDGARYAQVERTENREIELHCPSCAPFDESKVVALSGIIALHGAPEETLRWSDAGLGMRFGQDAMMQCRRGFGNCRYEVLVLALGTPASNVTSIHYRRRVKTVLGERPRALRAIMVGSAVMVLGSAIVLGASVDAGRFTTDSLFVASPILAIGGFVVGAGIAGLLATDSVSPVPIPPPS